MALPNSREREWPVVDPIFKSAWRSTDHEARVRAGRLPPRLNLGAQAPKASQRIERSGAWWRMLLEDAEVGVRLVGWLPRDILARSGGEEVTGIFGVARHGYLNALAGELTRRGDYFGLARLADGAAVYAEQGSTSWAVVRGPAVGRVLVRRGARWAEILDARRPGASASVIPPHHLAFIRVEDVQPLGPPVTTSRMAMWSSACPP